MSSTTAFVRSAMIYVGLPVFIIGVLGNILNVCCLWRTRHNPCGFIFIVSSFVNCLSLFYGLLVRILVVGFNQDWSTTNIVWCKTRLAFTQTLIYLSLSCLCLASIDRLFASCRVAKLRNFSRLSVIRWALIIIISFWLCHSVLYLIYSNIIRNPSTGIINCALVPNAYVTFYQTYIVLPLYIGLFPSTILITTGVITICNIKKLQMNRQRQIMQRQLTLMMLIQIPIIVLSTFPYTVFYEYIALSSNMTKSIDQRNLETIISTFMTLALYGGFGCQFFTFSISSSTFRQDMKNIFLCHISNTLRNNRIEPYGTTITQHPNPITIKIN